MVCPVCVVGGAGLVLSKIFGFPDIVVAFVNEMLSTSMAYWTNHVMAKRWKKRRGQLVAINILFGIMCLYSLKWIGLW